MMPQHADAGQRRTSGAIPEEDRTLLVEPVCVECAKQQARHSIGPPFAIHAGRQAR